MLIELEGVCYSYMAGSPAAVTALSDCSLGIGAGEFVAVIGPTGSGKSTLVQIMAGLEPPTSGRVRIDGVDLQADRKAGAVRRRTVGLVFQQPEKQLFESTVELDVAFWPKNAGLPFHLISERVRGALQAVGLDYEKYRRRSPFTLSGGEMRKVAVAGILVMEPRVLILDEPTVGLDPRGKRDLLDRIGALNKSGTAVVMVSHDLDDVAELASRVLVLDRGRLVADDTPRRMFGGECLVGDVFEPREPDPPGARRATRGPESRRGQGLPTASRIARLLRRRGLEIAPDPLTLDELEACIVAALEKASI